MFDRTTWPATARLLFAALRIQPPNKTGPPTVRNHVLLSIICFGAVWSERIEADFHSLLCLTSVIQWNLYFGTHVLRGHFWTRPAKRSYNPCNYHLLSPIINCNYHLLSRDTCPRLYSVRLLEFPLYTLSCFDLCFFLRFSRTRWKGENLCSRVVSLQLGELQLNSRSLNRRGQ